MVKIIKTYKPFTRAGLQVALAYRANFIFHMFGEIMKCFIMFFVWKAVFNNTDDKSFMGFDVVNMTLYLFITFLTGYLTYSEGSFAVGEEIRDGNIAMRLLKPCSFDMSFLFQEFGGKIISICIMFIPIVLGVEIYHCAVSGRIMFNVLNLILYVLSVILAYLISFYFNVCYGFLAFFLKNLWGTNILKEVIVGFLSGATIPLAFLPKVLSVILNILPFASLSYTPVMIYMGMYSANQIVISFLLQIFWLCAFWGISKLIWKGAVKRVCIQGG